MLKPTTYCIDGRGKCDWTLPEVIAWSCMVSNLLRKAGLICNTGMKIVAAAAVKQHWRQSGRENRISCLPIHWSWRLNLQVAPSQRYNSPHVYGVSILLVGHSFLSLVCSCQVHCLSLPVRVRVSNATVPLRQASGWTRLTWTALQPVMCNDQVPQRHWPDHLFS